MLNLANVLAGQLKFKIEFEPGGKTKSKLSNVFYSRKINNSVLSPRKSARKGLCQLDLQTYIKGEQKLFLIKLNYKWVTAINSAW